MTDPKKSKTFLHLGIIALFAVGAMSSAYFNGLATGNDMHQHYQFAFTIHQSLTNLEIYPGYAANFNEGYGDVAIRFYPPLTYYFLAISQIMIGNWFYASLFVFTILFFFSGIGAYLWAREEFSANQSLLAAGILIFAPYHINQIYNSFLLAEFAAAAVIPFCFLFVTKVCRNGRFQDVLGLAIFYAILILTHLPMTVIGSISFAIYGLFLLEKKSAFKTLAKLSVAILLALSASSFYWIRMITETKWINLSTETSFSDYYSYSNNFLFVPNNIINFATDNSFLWLADLMLLSVVLISIPSLIFFIKERKTLSKFSIAVGAVFIFSVFITTPLSGFIWDNLPFLQKVQFPWRWLGIVACCGAVFASGGIIRASETMKHSRNFLLPLGLGLSLLVFVFTTAFISKNALFVGKNVINQKMETLSSTNSFECWWTIWATPNALKTKEKIIIADRIFEIEKWDAHERIIKVSAGKAGLMRVAIFYYPHWKSTVNAQEIELEKDSDGVILIPVGAEESVVKLNFEEPLMFRITSIISLFTWLLLTVAIFFSYSKREKLN